MRRPLVSHKGEALRATAITPERKASHQAKKTGLGIELIVSAINEASHFSGWVSGVQA